MHFFCRLMSAPNFPLSDWEKLNDLAGVKNKKARFQYGFELLYLFGDGRVELQGIEPWSREGEKRAFYMLS